MNKKVKLLTCLALVQATSVSVSQRMGNPKQKPRAGSLDLRGKVLEKCLKHPRLQHGRVSSDPQVKSTLLNKNSRVIPHVRLLPRSLNF